MKVKNIAEINTPSIKPDIQLNELMQSIAELQNKNKTLPLLKVTIIFERSTPSTKTIEEKE